MHRKMATTFNTEVLISGAGPTGLMMAAQLAMHGIDFRIIDKNEDHTTQSRALVIHARSLEILEQMGMAEEAIKQGTITRQIGAMFNGKRMLRMEVKNMGEGLTKFPFLLMLEQSQTEALLNAFLEKKGHRVERLTELLEFQQDESGITATVRGAAGKTENVRAKYLVGADGAHSVVRHRLGIEFGGKTYSQSLFLVDCMAEAGFAPDEMCLVFSNNSVGGFFPLTNGRWRVLGTLPASLEGKEKISFEELYAGMAERLRMNVNLHDPHWVAVYHSHHRYAATFKSGRCFIAGDAAHIHSPVGAQGMNTGLQDAYNLAWKMAYVLRGKAKPGLLETYTEERIRIARTLVRTTDRAFHLATSKKFFIRIPRLYLLPIGMRLVLPFFQRSKKLRQLGFRILSEIGIHYRGSSLARDGHGTFSRRAPKAGDRLPYVNYEENGERKNIQEKITSPHVHLLAFSRAGKTENFTDALKLDDRVKVHVIPFSAETKRVYKRFGIKENGFYLVRPDWYILTRSTHFEPVADAITRL